MARVETVGVMAATISTMATTSSYKIILNILHIDNFNLKLNCKCF